MKLFYPLSVKVLLLSTLMNQPVKAGVRDGLTGYYAFETETAGTVPNAARDLSGPGFELDGLKLFGGEAAVAGVPLSNQTSAILAGTGALACDGEGDYADLPLAPITVDADFSVSVWFKPQTGGTGLTGATRAFVFESEPAFALSFGLRAGTTGTTNFQLFADLAAGTDPSQNVELLNAEVDAWHHLVLTYTASTNELLGYLDGALRYQLTLTGPLGTITGFHTGTYRLANGRWFKGFVDEQVFWQRTVTAEEALALFDAGTAGQSFAALAAPANAPLRTGLTAYYNFDTHTDRVVANAAVALGAPGFAGDGTTLTGNYNAPDQILPPLTNDPTLARAGNRSLLCDGVNNYGLMDGNPVDPAQSFTVSAWFKPDTGGLGYATVDTRAFIFESGTNFPLSFGLRGSLDPTQTTYQMFTLTSAGTTLSTSVNQPTEELDRWHHFAKTYDADTGTLTGYLDGIPVLTLSTLSGEFPVPLQGYSGFRLGTYRGADARFFKGLIDEVGMWQRSLTGAEVALLYAVGQAGLALPAAGAVPKTLSFGPVPGSPGVYAFSWATTPGLRYALEASSDLTDWSTTLAEEIPAAGTSLSFQISPTLPAPAGGLYDPGAAGNGLRFYRARLKF